MAQIAPTPGFNFMGLPPEIRVIIYELLLPTATELEIFDRRYFNNQTFVGPTKRFRPTAADHAESDAFARTRRRRQFTVNGNYDREKFAELEAIMHGNLMLHVEVKEVIYGNPHWVSWDDSIPAFVTFLNRIGGLAVTPHLGLPLAISWLKMVTLQIQGYLDFPWVVLIMQKFQRYIPQNRTMRLFQIQLGDLHSHLDDYVQWHLQYEGNPNTRAHWLRKWDHFRNNLLDFDRVDYLRITGYKRNELVIWLTNVHHDWEVTQCR
jgi:hypothetical protein